jgi:pimeloyl-ACP methyl ester carboxylesterase
MKKILFAISLLLSMHLLSQDIVSSWMGNIPISGKPIRLVFNINKSANGYSATFDSPDQNAFGFACSKVLLQTDSLFIDVASLQIKFAGLWNGKDEVNGIFYQGNGKYTLLLKRLAANEVPKPAPVKIRAQTPKPPYNYDVEDVLYYNADKSVRFGATFTKPKGDGPFTTIIIITGSGTQDRDGTMFGHKTYAVLADYLTNKGIAVLRVDDRGAGKTTLGKNFMKLTSADFANDVEAGIAYLQTKKEVGKIGLVGHSEGGMIAPMVAARNQAVNFIVMLAGPGQNGEDIWKYQMQRSFEKTDLSKPHKKLADELVNSMNDAFMHSANYDSVIAEMKSTYAKWKLKVDDSLEAKLFNVAGIEGFTSMAKAYKGGLSWLQYFMLYNPSIALQKVTCPVLAMNGESDVQVLCKPNLAAVEAALKKGGNKQYTIKAFPNLNHLFQTCNNINQSYEEIDETFAPVALSFIAKFIQQQKP